VDVSQVWLDAQRVVAEVPQELVFELVLVNLHISY